MPAKAVITIPVYKTELSEEEIVSFSQALRVFKDRDIVLVCTDNLDTSKYKEIAEEHQKTIHYEFFDEFFFKNIVGYNNLMLSSSFYDRFNKYEYLLIYQLDCFVFRDELDKWCDKGYDYIGAPWLHNDRRSWWTLKNSVKYKLKALYRRYANKPITISMGYYKVGNGGFSLRKISKSIAVIKKFEANHRIDEYRKSDHYLYAEDVFWGCEVNRYFPNIKIPNYKEALPFAFDMSPSLCYELNNNTLPFGCHAWYRYEAEFWKPIVDRFVSLGNI